MNNMLEPIHTHRLKCFHMFACGSMSWGSFYLGIDLPSFSSSTLHSEAVVEKKTQILNLRKSPNNMLKSFIQV